MPARREPCEEVERSREDVECDNADDIGNLTVAVVLGTDAVDLLVGDRRRLLIYLEAKGNDCSQEASADDPFCASSISSSLMPSERRRCATAVTGRIPVEPERRSRCVR